MDSIGNLARVEGFKANLDVNGETLRRADQTEQRVLVGADSLIDPGALLGGDMREKLKVSLIGPGPSYTNGEIVLMVNAQKRIKLTKRDNGPSDPFTEYDAVYVVADKDTA